MTTIVLPADTDGHIIDRLWTLGFLVMMGEGDTFNVTLPARTQTWPHESRDESARTIYSPEGEPFFDIWLEGPTSNKVVRIVQR